MCNAASDRLARRGDCVTRLRRDPLLRAGRWAGWHGRGDGLGGTSTRPATAAAATATAAAAPAAAAAATTAPAAAASAAAAASSATAAAPAASAAAAAAATPAAPAAAAATAAAATAAGAAAGASSAATVFTGAATAFAGAAAAVTVWTATTTLVVFTTTRVRGVAEPRRRWQRARRRTILGCHEWLIAVGRRNDRRPGRRRPGRLVRLGAARSVDGHELGLRRARWDAVCPQRLSAEVKVEALCPRGEPGAGNQDGRSSRAPKRRHDDRLRA
jgi:hypothetical protein